MLNGPPGSLTWADRIVVMGHLGVSLLRAVLPSQPAPRPAEAATADPPVPGYGAPTFGAR
jgi:hypothetical protein